jgi:PAT family beta-lactamase induction signal transducer AmpG
MTASADAEPKRNSWLASLATYRDRRVLAMLFLGYSAGLPFLLVFGTLSAWLRETGISRTTIGFFVLAGFAYSLKFAWAPFVDRLPLPFLDRRLGRRRSWMLLAQVIIAIGLTGVAFADPHTNIAIVAAFAVLTAFGSATQDIAIDAFRIESAPLELQGAAAGAYQLGYRLALLSAGAGALKIAHLADWTAAYLTMAGLVAVGVVTVLLVREPERPSAQLDAATAGLAAPLEKGGPLARAGAWLMVAVVGPFMDFFGRHGWNAVLILLLIGCYRLTDITMGVMANPFYIDVGFTKGEIAEVSGFYGVWVGIAGALLGGVIVARWGMMWPLVICAFLAAASNLLFYVVAVDGREILDLGACQSSLCLPDDPAGVRRGDIWLLYMTLTGENLVGGAAGTVLIAYLSSLTNTAYTATQYALFGSLWSLVGKLVASTSGLIIDETSYPFFFVYTAVLGAPAVLFAFLLMLHTRRSQARGEQILASVRAAVVASGRADSAKPRAAE